MIVVDSSAAIAWLRQEPEMARIERTLTSGEEFAMSAVSAYETRIVLGARFGASAVQAFDLFLARWKIAVLPFDDAQAIDAQAAYVRFGKGSGQGAALNMGDCAAYALARSLDSALLYVGKDFAKTDIETA